MVKPFSSQILKGNATLIQAEAKAELLQWVWGPFNFERLVVISLVLQFILFFAAPFRKSTSRGWVLTLIWAAYLVAEWVSYYSIQLVLNGETGRDANHLHVLWSSLLLAHLSGPETISVLDMEDHYLWSRTALKFGTIAFYIARVTTKTFTHNADELAAELHRSSNISHAQVHRLLSGPTLLLFMVGIVKSLEKIATLVLNRTNLFQDRVVSNIHDPNHPMKPRIDQGAVLVKVHNKPVRPRSGKLSPFEALRDAYRLFLVFRGCFVDFKLEFEDGGRSIRDYFFARTAEDAFLVIETELNLVYDVFYTKASHVYKAGVRFVRYMIVIAEFVALGFLATKQMNKISNWFDAPITQALILGALLMDAISALRMAFSIRAIPPHDDREASTSRGRLLDKILSLQRRSWGGSSSRREISYLQYVKRVLFRRWSESIPQFNFIDYCLRRHPRILQSLYHFLGVKEKIHKAAHVDQVWFTNSLRNFVFDELKKKARLLENLESGLYNEWITERELYKSLFIWHIATDFCWTDPGEDIPVIVEDRSITVPVIVEDESVIIEDVSKEKEEWRKWSKTLPDYMLCLLTQHPGMLKQSEVGLMAKLTLESACGSLTTPKYSGWLSRRHDEYRHWMIDQMRGDGKDEVVMEGYRLAERLKGLGSRKLEVASKVWVELLCRTAVETNPSAHITTLNKGGELVTLVWLLMNHLGIENWGRKVERS